MKLSYAVTVNDEYNEIVKLVELLIENKDREDEVVILQDISKGETLTDNKLKVFRYLTVMEKNSKEHVKFSSHALDNDFAQQKNYLNSICKGNYIFQLDADETIPIFLMRNIKTILEYNSNIEAFYVPRVNTVKGITEQHIAQWGWRVNEQGWINFPDKQMRIYKNNGKIKWERTVHEYLTGYHFNSHLPYEAQWAIRHAKKIEKQVKQNEMYKKIITGE